VGKESEGSPGPALDGNATRGDALVRSVEDGHRHFRLRERRRFVEQRRRLVSRFEDASLQNRERERALIRVERKSLPLETTLDAALTALAARLLLAQDDERRRMARELHDTTMQNLAAAHMLVERLRQGGSVLNRPWQDVLGELQGLVMRSVDELRRFSSLLHPPLLKELGLVSALKPFIAAFEKRTGITVSLAVRRGYAGMRAPKVDEALFHMVEEALSNVHRHSGSATAEVRLTPNATETVLEVVDRGRGMPDLPLSGDVSEIATIGLGLRSMCARLQPLGGRLYIRSTGSGTTLAAHVPNNAKREDEASLDRPAAKSKRSHANPRILDPAES